MDEPDVPVRFCVDTASIGRRGTFLLAGAGVGFPAGKRGQRHLRECFCLQSPQLTIRRPAMHRGVPSLSMVIESGMDTGLPRFSLRSMKGWIPPLLAEPIGRIVVMGGVQADVPDGDIVV